MKHLTFITGIVFGILISGCVLGGIALSAVSISRLAHTSCRDYKTQPEAQAAYDAGAHYLDGDGDHIACESLLNYGK